MGIYYVGAIVENFAFAPIIPPIIAISLLFIVFGDILITVVKAFPKIIKMLKNLTVFTTSSLDVTNSIEKDVASYIESSKLEELMRIKDGASSIKFFILEGSDDNHVKELLMFVKGLTDMTKNQNITINGKQRVVETVLLSLKGDIDLREVSKLTTKLNVPGGELLKKATKE